MPLDTLIQFILATSRCRILDSMEVIEAHLSAT